MREDLADKLFWALLRMQRFCTRSSSLYFIQLLKYYYSHPYILLSKE